MNGSTHRGSSFKRSALKRLAAFALALALMSGLLPFFPTVPDAGAADWMQPYLDQMVEWGIMQGDANGNLNPDRQITRAEFVTLVNRAFGYTEMDPENPFSDVPDDAWYSEDIRIAHKAGYFNGTSDNTASPLSLMTREQAAALIGRNLRIDPTPGMTTTFLDNQDIGVWSRGLVQKAADMGIVQGYADGTFRPKNFVTRGHVACFLSRALGTLIQEPGDQSLGGVYGNVTITSPGVTLRDTTITGNLYLTSGIGLGNVELENVTVLGEIIVSGAGESHEGDSSVILRNVKAAGMEVDSLTDQFVTIRTEGLTEIEHTSVRSSAYLEDLTEDGLGMKYIELDGDNNPNFQLAGNIKEVKNLSPDATVVMAQGVADKFTMDEVGTNSVLTIDNSASIRELNLDTATNVAGTGSVGILNVSTDGSVVSMLPDSIVVRPGVTANVNREQMDTVLAEESSEEPRLLSGYPKVRNIASTSVDGVFSVNKKGTIRWALTAMTDGSASEEELLNPGAYPAKILKSGTLNATASKTELIAKLSGLTRSGSYYLSAMLVDNRNHYSPVKITSFTTTDDSTPNFSSGYPTVILSEDKNGDQVVQSMVMATKNCRLYYALLPKGSTAPTPDALKSGAVTGNLGYGTVELYKDTPYLLSHINTTYLAEQTSYDLYLWLIDADNGKSSAIKKLTVTTLDKTPPTVRVFQTGSAGNRATMTFSMSEPGTLFWAIVPAGDTFLRPAVAGEEIRPEDLAAKIQVENGTYSTAHGRANAAKGDTNYTFNVSPLQPQMSYDLYYVAKDRAGNYSLKVEVFTPVKTLDEIDPTVTQDFSLKQKDASGKERPLTETDVMLNFSEVVWGTYKDKNEDKYDDFEALYKEVQAHEDEENPNRLNQAKDALGAALEKYITFQKHSDAGTFVDAVIRAPGQTDDAWDIDFREAVVSKKDGKMTITFLNGKGINLQSGGTYQFKLQSICDTSGNVMDVTTLPEFTTIFATVNLAIGDTNKIYKNEVDQFGDSVATEGTGDAEYVRIDRSFTMNPVSTQRVPAGTGWDLLLWTDQTISFTLYSRTRDSANRWQPWHYENTIPTLDVRAAADQGGRLFVSLDRYIRGETDYPALRDMNREMEFAIHVDSIEEDRNYAAWNKNVTIQATVLAGKNYPLSQTALTTAGFKSDLERGLENGSVSIGVKDPFEVIIPFTDKEAPKLKESYPNIDAGDIAADIQVMLDRPGKVYYVVAPLVDTSTEDDKQDGELTIKYITEKNYRCPVEPLTKENTRPDIEDVPGVDQDGKDIPNDHDITESDMLYLAQPFNTQVTKGIQGTKGVFSGSTRSLTANVAETIRLSGLMPNTTYFVYMVTQGVSPVFSETMVFQFSTVAAIKPILDIERVDSENAVISVDKSSVVDYILVESDSLTSGTFSQLFTYNTANPGASTATKEWDDIKSTYNVKTILDAMLTSYYRNGAYMGSIFDNFASDSARNTVAERIRSTATEGASAPVDKATISLTLPTDALEGERVSTDMINFTQKMEADGTYYTLLAVARTTNSSKDSFRAAAPFFVPDNELLTVVGLSLSDDSSTVTGVTGQLIVTFSDNLYYRKTTSSGTTGQNKFLLDMCDKLANGHAGIELDVEDGNNTYGNVGRFLTLGKGISVAGIVTNGDHTPVGKTLVFDLFEVANKRTILLDASVCGENARTHSKPLTLTFVRNPVVDPANPSLVTYEYEVQVTPSDWDGR